MEKVIPKLDTPGLRKFGLMSAGIVAVLFGALLPWLFGAAYPLWPWIMAGILAAWALLVPATLNPVYKTWMHIGLFVGRINTFLILVILYYAVFTPMGLVMRLLGKDPMNRQIDPGVQSYRKTSTYPPKEQMEKTY